MNLFDVLNMEEKELEVLKGNYNCDNNFEFKKKICKYYKNRKNIVAIGEKKSQLREYLVKNNYKEVEELLEDADRFLEGEIIFDRKWDMERCKKAYQFDKTIDWTIVPFKDPEWTYMLNRHKHLLLYAWSYFITEEDRYFYKLKDELIDWIDNIKLQDENMTVAWRTIEAGIRLRNWTKIFELIIEHRDFDCDFLQKILLSVDEHIHFILRNSREDRILSNWVILENHGVFIASSFFKELKISEEGRKKSLKMIERALDIQILYDGLQWEQSFMYHNEMVNCILDLIIIGERNDVVITGKIKEKLTEMLKATLNMADPNLNQINFGDSDEEDLRDIVTLGAVVLKWSELKCDIEKIPLETLLAYGYDSVEIFNTLDINLNKKNKSRAYLASGNYILRNKFGKDGTFTFFKCGPLGSGHGHYDLLHLGINYKGDEILSDSGRYSYREDEPLRVLLKSAVSHNTLIVDNAEFNHSKGSWGSTKVSNYIKREFNFLEGCSYVEGGHLGYMDKGVFVNRKVIYIEPNIWILSDEFFAEGIHDYKQIFNFNKPLVSVCDESFGRIINYKTESGYKFKLIPMNKLKIEVKKGYISKEYNSIYETDKVVLETKGEGNMFLNTVMYVDEKDVDYKIEYIEILDWKKKVLDSRFGRAIKITNKECEYIVVIATDEEPSGRKTYIVDGSIIYGRVVLIKRENGNEDVKVLSY